MSIKFKLGLPFSLVGTPLLIGGIVWGANSVSRVMNSESVIGKVVDNIVDTCESTNNNRTRTYTCYQPVVKYDFAGQSYQLELSERSSSRYNMGEDFKLSVDPKEPGAAYSLADLWVGPIAISLFGAIFSAIGISLLVSHFRRKKLEKELVENGIKTRATVISLDVNTSIAVNGKHPLILRAQFTHPSEGTTIVAELPELWHDPSLAGEIAEDGTVEVLYDRKEPQRCMIKLVKQKGLKAA